MFVPVIWLDNSCHMCNVLLHKSVIIFFYCCQKGVELSRKASIVLNFPWPDLFGTSYIVPPCKLYLAGTHVKEWMLYFTRKGK